MPTDALHHLIINLDVQDSGQLTNPEQMIMRAVVYDIVQSAFAATGIDPHRPPDDRGDGVLLVLPATVPEEQMVGRWVKKLHQALKRRNSQPSKPVRVRVGIHAGQVHHDDQGAAGTDVNIACRLANCEPAKGTLRAATRASMVVAVSDVIYQSVVRHDGPHIDRDSYRKHALRTAEYDGPVWLRVPGYSIPPAPASAPESDPAPPPPPQTTRGGVGSIRAKIGGRGVVLGHVNSVGDVVLGDMNQDRPRHER